MPRCPDRQGEEDGEVELGPFQVRIRFVEQTEERFADGDDDRRGNEEDAERHHQRSDDPTFEVSAHCSISLSPKPACRILRRTLPHGKSRCPAIVYSTVHSARSSRARRARTRRRRYQ